MPVPNVVGQNVDDATTTLQGAGLVVIEQLQPDDKKPEGSVISTDPAAGSNVAKGTSVKLNVSSGKAKVLVPDETGRTINQALQDLGAAGLQARVVRQPSDQPVDTVLTSNPPPGTQVDKGTVITLTVSSGAPTTTTEATTTTTTEQTTTTTSLKPTSTTATSIKP